MPPDKEQLTKTGSNGQARKVTVKDIQRYYRDYFDPAELISIIGLSTFYRREFAFLLEDGSFIRNISFKTSTELKEFLSTNRIRRSYVGAVYEIPPSKNNTIQKIKWSYREFCFDLDLNDYDLVRTCGCRGKEQYCEFCWSLLQDAVAFLDRTLREDFGFKDIVWVFSGRRGFHGWVRDPTAGTLNQSQRNSIINYLTLIRDEKRTQAVEKDLKHVIPLRNRILEMIGKSYFQRATVKELQAAPFKFTKEQINRLQYNLKKGSMPFSKIYDGLLGKKHNRDAIFTHIIKYRYPRIDRKVSIDIRRILKIPGSVQDTNGKICCKVDINKIHQFYPENAPTIWDYLS
ncbi:MAG: DNA primase catalytic subunit PriS [Candidatus Heimdallarchaeota archaeon]